MTAQEQRELLVLSHTLFPMKSISFIESRVQLFEEVQRWLWAIAALGLITKEEYEEIDHNWEMSSIYKLLHEKFFERGF